MTAGSTGSELERLQVEATEKLNAAFELHEAFSKDLTTLWIKYQQSSELDPTMLNRITSQSCLHWAATLAVDINQTEETFANIARACYRLAYKKAVKFG